jgi:glycosyltransferase involved in cell wall biosynthesis
MTLSALPKINVVMTVYNGASHLSDAVQSVLDQTFQDFEFIIVDNNSSDNSVDIIRRFQDNRIHLIPSEHNLGQTKALNIGIQASRAPYIARMDADDICLPQRLAKQYEFMEKHPQIGLLGSRAININEHNQVIGKYNVPTDPHWLYCCLCASGDLTRWSLIHPSVMIRRSVLDQSGLYNEKKSVSGYPQDYDLWARVIRHADVANLKEPLLRYRVLAASESRSFSEIFKYRLEISREKIRQYLPGLPETKIEPLARMLEFMPQQSAQDGEAMFDLFDRYFDKFTAGRIPAPRTNYYKTRIKFYYLSQLIKTHSKVSRKLFFTFLLHYPRLAGDPCFYAKIIKSKKRDS